MTNLVVDFSIINILFDAGGPDFFAGTANFTVNSSLNQSERLSVTCVDCVVVVHNPVTGSVVEVK